MGPVLDEVIGPDMVRPARPQPDTGTVSEPETAPLGLLPGDFQPLPSPNALDPLRVDTPVIRTIWTEEKVPHIVAPTVNTAQQGIASGELACGRN